MFSLEFILLVLVLAFLEGNALYYALLILLLLLVSHGLYHLISRPKNRIRTILISFLALLGLFVLGIGIVHEPEYPTPNVEDQYNLCKGGVPIEEVLTVINFLEEKGYQFDLSEWCDKVFLEGDLYNLYDMVQEDTTNYLVEELRNYIDAILLVEHGKSDNRDGLVYLGGDRDTYSVIPPYIKQRRNPRNGYEVFLATMKFHGYITKDELKYMKRDMRERKYEHEDKERLNLK